MLIAVSKWPNIKRKSSNLVTLVSSDCGQAFGLLFPRSRARLEPAIRGSQSRAQIPQLPCTHYIGIR